MIDIPIFGCITKEEFDIIRKAHDIEERERVRCGEHPVWVNTDREKAELTAKKAIANFPRCD